MLPQPDHGIFSRDTVPGEVIIVPVVVHVIFNNEAQNLPEAQVRSQIEALNRDFRRMNADTSQTPTVFRSVAADTRIMFCLAQVDPQGRRTSGIVRRYTNKAYFLGDDAMKFTAAGGNDAWDSKRYLNIWVCNLFGRSLGYATMPGGAADKDGVVINYDVFGTVGNLRNGFDKGRTTTHEVAHWLGLQHIWGDENCGDDGVSDTPVQFSYNNFCPNFPNFSSCPGGGSSGDMFMNFMDYTNDACMNLFTKGQAKRMRAQFANAGSRNSLLSSYVCDSSLASGAPLPDDTLVVQQPAGGIRVYPNPVVESFCVESTEGYTLANRQLQLFSASGTLVRTYTVSSNRAILSMAGIPAGVYFLKTGNAANRQVIRILKR